MSDLKDDLVSRAILRLAQQTRYLAPWTALPLARTSTAVADVLQHLTSQPVHNVYFPFVRFSVMHAARVSIAWAAMTRGRRSVGLFADMFGYLVIAWGGGTLVSLLLGSPPAWLISPVPWLVYVAVYLLAVPTRLASVLGAAPALPLNLVLSLVDGMSRGVAVASMPALTEASSKTIGSWLAPAVLGVIGTCGGGWIAQTLGLAKESWAMGRPSVLGGGVWDTLDVWAALIAGVAYAALDGRYPELRSVRPLVTEALPDDLEINAGVARAVAVLIFTGFFVARTLALYFRPVAKAAEQHIQVKSASLPAKAAALSEKTKAEPVTAIKAKAKAETPVPETPPRRSTRSMSRANTPGAAVTPATPATGEDTPSKPRKRRTKKKTAA